jgi:putative nucleotidyltransferase with HDIG domain
MGIDQIINSLPPLPLTVANVLKVTMDSEDFADDLVKAILPDPTMCAAILKVANSALYGHSKEISSLHTAIMVLGFKEVQSIVLGKAAISTFREPLTQHQEEIGKFWEHSFTCGLAAKIIAENLGLATGQFFMGGLLHDIGKLVLFLAMPDKYLPVDRMISFSTEEHLADEKQKFSIGHDNVGGRLLKRWLFPENLILALEYHHYPQNAPILQGYPLVIQLADVMSFLCCNPQYLVGRSLVSVITEYLPDIETQWKNRKLLWNQVMIESWFAWLKIDQTYGSSIMHILSV